MNTYKGSCHCGEVVFSVKTDLRFSTLCDCSLCRRRGAAVVRCHEDDLTIVSGEASLRLYQFDSKQAQHYFCTGCGIHTFYRLKKLPDQFGINAGCLDGVDTASLTPTRTYGSRT